METISKFSLYALCIAAVSFIGCNHEQEDKVRKEAEMQEYRMEVLRTDLHNNFNKTLTEINQNLEMLSVKRGEISVGPESPMENGISLKQRVLRNIQIINGMLEENKEKIALLKYDMKKYKMENSALYNKLSNDADQLKEFERQMSLLKTQLASKSFTVEELNQKISYLEAKSEVLQVQSDRNKTESDLYKKQLNTGYYLCENRKALEKQGVLVHKGGVLGIGSVSEVNENLPENTFHEIDITKTTDIPITGKKPTLVSSHPEGSYEFKEENNMITYLHIQDPDKFWKTSKYMVVAVK